MNQAIREASLEAEIERLKDKLNEELENTSLVVANILHISQELDILITQYVKNK